MMKKIIFTLLLLITGLTELQAQKQTTEKESNYVVTMVTNKGTVQLKLYNETPKHRDNFVTLINQGFYNHLLFHRVIRDFMIQCGDPDTRDPLDIAHYGDNGAAHTIEPEINEKYFHKRGALAAAREGDEINPDRLSSGSHFYIVVGQVFDDSLMQKVQERIADNNGMPMNKEREKVYRNQGGTPHLDGSYTVFGEVIKGMNVVQKISDEPTTPLDRPKEDIYIKEMKVEMVEFKKKKKK